MEYFEPSSVRLAEALERALLQWRKRRAAPRSPGSLTAPIPPPFTIALSCEAGVDGQAVAQALGERLGWHVYDHELVEQIARELKVRTELLESLDERRMSWLQEMLQPLFTDQPVSEFAYAHHLAQTLLALAAHGECIIVGHGGAQVLPAASTLRVRLMGPRPDRITAMQRRGSWSREEAERRIEQMESERNAFVKEHFRKDPADPQQYDLLLNAFRFAPPHGAEIILTALRQLQGAALGQPPVQSAAISLTSAATSPGSVCGCARPS